MNELPYVLEQLAELLRECSNTAWGIGPYVLDEWKELLDFWLEDGGAPNGRMKDLYSGIDRRLGSSNEFGDRYAGEIEDDVQDLSSVVSEALWALSGVLGKIRDKYEDEFLEYVRDTDEV